MGQMERLVPAYVYRPLFQMDFLILGEFYRPKCVVLLRSQANAQNHFYLSTLPRRTPRPNWVERWWKEVNFGIDYQNT